jgi:GT2 family glycosyltransferase
MTLDHTQPRVRGNDWPGLSPGRLGEWTPTLSVSVVIPAYGAARTLPYTLAALAVQTYPEDLIEVVVVDDGTEPPLELPERRPVNTRIVRTGESWGRAHACHTGALASSGQIVHWLDADMLPHRDEVEAQLRWHHLVDHAVVMGHKLFVDVSDEAGGLPDLDETLAAVAEGRAAALFSDRWTSGHEWVEEQIAKTQGLTVNPTRSYLVHTGASASVPRDLYDASGGMDPLLKLGEDVELGYRLAQRGAVFVPDDHARSWHLGRTTLMQQQEQVNRYNRPFVTDRVPDLRHWRTKGRGYSVPWVTAVVDARGATLESVRHSVDALLTASFHDLEVVLVGPWASLRDERRSPLGDPDRELRLVHAEYVGEGRVRFEEDVPDSAFPAPYRLLLPTGWAPDRDAVARLAREMAKLDRGLVSVLLPDGQVARLERTSAFTRAARVVAPGEDLDDAVDDVSGTWWFNGVEEGFTGVGEAEEVPPPEVPTGSTGGSARKPKSRGGASRDDVAPRDEVEAPPAPDDASIGDKARRVLRRRRTG